MRCRTAPCLAVSLLTLSLVLSAHAKAEIDAIESVSVTSSGAESPLPQANMEGAPTPFTMVRTLQSLQDQIAQGSIPALAAQRTLLARFDAEFLAMDATVWQDPRNARAAVLYVLSGGNPVLLRKLASLKPPPAVDEALMRGALAYVEGRAPEAARLLNEIDVLKLPSGLGGQVAMAQSALNVGEDPRKAMEHLAKARLIAPGTLVEEAALRREILIAAQVNDLQRFESLARQYLNRFRSSVYAGNFRQRFAAALTRMDFINDREHFTRLEALLHDLERESQRDIYLMIARGAVSQGKAVAAQLASERVLTLSPSREDEARAVLYRAAALAVSREGISLALTSLKTINRRLLTPADSSLYEAVSVVAESVRTAAEPRTSLLLGDALTNEPPPSSPIKSRAQDTLEAIDQLLKQAPP
jgi:chemotaxis protein MotC